MITSPIQMPELPNLGRVTTSTIKSDSRGKIYW